MQTNQAIARISVQAKVIANREIRLAESVDNRLTRLAAQLDEDLNVSIKEFRIALSKHGTRRNAQGWTIAYRVGNLAERCVADVGGLVLWLQEGLDPARLVNLIAVTEQAAAPTLADTLDEQRIYIDALGKAIEAIG